MEENSCREYVLGVFSMWVCALLKRNKKSSNSAETQRAYNAEFLHMSHYGLHKSEIPQLHPLQ